MINKQLINLSSPASSGGNAGEEGLILHLDANDVDSYDGDGTEWVDITNHEYTPETNAEEHFNTVLYTGNSSTNAITGVGFQPDLVWIKDRNVAEHPMIYDSIRGATNALLTTLTNTQYTGLTTTLTSFDSDGFSLGSDAQQWVNTTNRNYVAWCFKAGGAPSGSDKVSIDGTSYATMAAAGLTGGTAPIEKLSVNTKLGFSTVKYTFSSPSASQTVAHGLSSAPEMIITKSTTGTGSWYTYHKDVGTGKYLQLDSSAQAATYANGFSTVDSTSWQQYFRSDAQSYIAYCFASKRGVSKVGSYTGNGSTTGPIVYLGFEPAFLMFKCSSQTGNWIVIDNKRATSNPRTPHLRANSNSADDFGTNEYVDFLGNGFQPKGVSNYNNNSSGQTYIYYAVAKNTNETSLIPDKDDFTAGSIETTNLELDLDANDYSGSGNWLDGTSNNNDGAIAGATYVNDGSSDYFDFDGVNDKVTTSYDIPSAGAKTIEFWFNDNGSSGTESTFPSPVGGSNAVIWTGGDLTSSFSDESLGFYNADTGLHFYIRTGTNTYRDNKWHHVAITDNGSNQHAVYVDGESHSISYLAGSSSSRISMDNVQIGKGQSTPTTGIYSYYFNGQVGQVRIYSSALTPAQIKSNYDATKIYALPSLELHLDAGGDTTVSTSTWSDKTSNNNNVTLTNFSSTLTDFYEKEVGNYIKFDGLNDLATSTLPVTATGDVTMEAWVRFTDSTSASIYPYITHLGHGNVDGNGFSMARFANTGSDAYKFYNHLGGSYQVSNKVLEEDRWYHVCATWAGTSLKQYVDGELVGNHTLTFNKNLYNAFTVGAYRPSDVAYNHYLKGGLGQVRVYQSALSLDQIRQNYNFTKNNYPNGFDGTINGATFNPGGYFDFDGNDLVELPISVATSNILTVSLWFNSTSNNNPIGIFSARGPSSPSVRMLITLNRNAAGEGTIGLDSASSSNFLTLGAYDGNYNDGNWHHVVASINYTTKDYIVYIDGVSRISGNNSSISTNHSINKVYLGANYAAQYLYGEISKVKIYDKTLTQAEITALHSEGE